jgi:CubicO group peptidase (beta-lactamase class C family)
MRISLVLFLFCTLSVLGTAIPITGLPVPELVTVDSAVVRLMRQYGLPGGAVAITKNGRLVYWRGFGIADSTAGTQVQPESVFRLASVSKQFTSVAILQLLEQGKLALSDRVFGVNGILFDPADSTHLYTTLLDPRDTLITIQHLLEHTAGWNRDRSGDQMFNSLAIASEAGTPHQPANALMVIRHVLSRMMLDYAPGSKFNYSNVGYCVLGRVIEKLTGQDYESYVRDHILTPLGITRGGMSHNLRQEALPDEVTYYTNDGSLTPSVYGDGTNVPWPYGGFNIEAMDSPGGWVLGAADLLRFVTAVDGFATRPDILSAATIDIMVRPSVRNVNYAKGWAVNSNNSWWHTGSLPGSATEIVRTAGGLTWSILFNLRNDESAFVGDVDNLIWNATSGVTSWPEGDQFDVSGTAEAPTSDGFAVYPTLARDLITVQFGGILAPRVRVELVNMLGKTLVAHELYRDSFTRTLAIHTSGVPPGVYLVCLRSGNESYRQMVRIIGH